MVLLKMVLLRESGMPQPAIAEVIGVSLSTVNRSHMAYEGGGIKALKPKPIGSRQRENMTQTEEGALLAFCQRRWSGRDVEHPRSQGGL
jgi:transposase